MGELVRAKAFMPAGMSITAEEIRTSPSAITSIGTGGGGDNFLKINHRTGAITYGMENTPLPESRRRFVVPVRLITHGYTVNLGGKPAEKHLVPFFGRSDRPVPPGGRYVDYGQDGARAAIELALNSIDERGLALTFTSWSISHDNRLRKLLELVRNHADTREADEGFVHPVIRVKAGSYPHPDFGVIYHFDFDPLGWLHDSGRKFVGEIAAEFDGADPAEDSADDVMPWDDMTDDEQEVLGTA